mgnify:CR=1 FL=1
MPELVDGQVGEESRDEDAVVGVNLAGQFRQWIYGLDRIVSQSSPDRVERIALEDDTLWSLWQ